jgi:hypothetical protein
MDLMDAADHVTDGVRKAPLAPGVVGEPLHRHAVIIAMTAISAGKKYVDARPKAGHDEQELF